MSDRAIRKAINSGRLPATRKIAESGRHANRPYYEIALEDLFKVYPAAKRRWELEQDASLLADRQRRQAEEARLRNEATRQAALAARPENVGQVATARAWHCQRFDQFQREIGETAKVATTRYVLALKDGQLSDIPDWVQQATGTFSESTLTRWRKALQEGGVAALEPQYRSVHISTLEANPEMGEYALALLVEMPHLSPLRIHEALKAKYKDAVPSASAVVRWLNKWKRENAQQYLQLTNPDKAKNKFQPAMGSRSEDVVELNQRWETDATKADLFFLNDPRRWTLCAVVDIYSDRRMFYLAESSKGLAHGLLFRRAILAWGLPRQIKTDNGKDYTSKYMTRFFADLEIEQLLCRPFSGEEKPHVERGFRTFLHDLVELLPGFAGHNVAQAQDLRAQKSFEQRLKAASQGDAVEVGISREDFLSFMGRWCAADEHRVRTSGRLKGRSPALVVDAWAAERPVRRIKDPLVLDWLLCEAKTKTVQKDGIQHDHRMFIAPELAPIIGRKVEIRVSPEDIGRLSVFHDGQFVCMAECPEITGIKPAEVAAKGRALKKAGDQATREFQRRLKSKITSKKAVVDAILDERLAQAGPVRRLQVSEHVETTSMAAAAAAATAEALAEEAKAQNQVPEVRQLPLSPEQERRVRDDLARKAPEDPKERYIRLMREPMVTAEDRTWMDHFETTKAGKSILATLRLCSPTPKAQ